MSVGADGILIVDDQFAPLADKIKASLKTLGQGKLRFILNTHWHGDHTGGNAAFGPEATIVAHDNVRKRLSTEQRSEFFKSTTPFLGKNQTTETCVIRAGYNRRRDIHLANRTGPEQSPEDSGSR